jgi:16S rRNA (cytosine967-C5)-methyltransferase
MRAVRRLAISALGKVFARGAKPSDALDALSEGLDRRDRAFLMELVYGVLRYRDTLDWVLLKFLENPRGLRRGTMDNLRLGLYQILFLRVPDWASVNEAVGVEQRRKGLVNAVLRNVLRERERLEQELGDMEKNVADGSLSEEARASSIALLTSHPLWLIKRWVGRFGFEEAFELARAGNLIPPLTLRVNTLRASRDDAARMLGEIGIESEPTAYSPVGLRLGGAHTFRDLGGLSGLVRAQDEAAQLVACMLDPRPGERVLDACAAPGGKTTHIAQMMGDAGEVVAVEIDEKRISRLRENVSEMGLGSVKVVRGDIARLDSIGAFDRVMVDAPCSATGVIRRNPDVKYRRKEGDLLKYREKQLRILLSAAGRVRPGGTLLYCTCSTEPEEGEEVVEALLKSSANFFIIEDAPFEAPFVREGVLRTYPHRNGMDGFFCVRLRRRG